jgi:hypothetical protein
MMGSSLSFELVLLDRMSRDYKLSVLHEIGLTEAAAAELQKGCRSQYPALAASDLANYQKLLGPEIPRDKVPGCNAHYFLLMLWPHLFLVIEELEKGGPCAIGFENQAVPVFQAFDPGTIRAGLWTRRALEQIADRHQLHDGWDEEVVVRFAFGDRLFEGKFVFGLLQEWRSVLHNPGGSHFDGLYP